MGQLNKENKKYSHSFQRIKDIVELLRVACPWDAKQTIHSLRPQSIEELYELTDAIDNEDWEGIKEELGDLTLHILFYAQLAKEQGRFDIYDVFKTVSDKLVRRHPHVYGSVKTKGEKEILSNWETIKQSEGKKTKSILAGVPKSAPAFSKSISIQNKAKQVGFDWTCISDVKKKYLEEWSELEEAIASKDTKHIEEELEMFYSA